MAYVAFDLDNTLGYFDILAPVAFLWSPEVRRSPPIAEFNAPFHISPTLEKKLARARSRFASSLMRYPALLNKILRPNLSTLLHPLLDAVAARKVKTVIIYSNTSNYYTMELAKTLIERIYKCPGLFSLIADAYHPLRNEDYFDPFTNEPLKTFGTLETLFRSVTRTSGLIHPSEVAFIDDREPLHELANSVPDGLVYIQPTSFSAPYSHSDRQTIFRLAHDALHYSGLTDDIEYDRSGLCNFWMGSSRGTFREIRGLPDLLDLVWWQIATLPSATAVWRQDAFAGQKMLSRFFRRF